MLQYFETILRSVESLLSSYQDEVYFMVWWGSWRRVTSSTMGTILDFTTHGFNLISNSKGNFLCFT